MSPGAAVPIRRRWLPVAVAIYTALLLACGPWLHPVGIRGALDGYADRAEAILDGRWIADPFHPFLYPQVVALVTLAVGDGFVAARIVSSCAAGLFVFAAVRLAGTIGGSAVAAWTAVWLFVNGSLLTIGVEASSDMAATALVTAGLWQLAEPRQTAAVLRAGLCFGLATATRYNSACLAPAVVVVLLAGPGRLGERLRHAAVCGAAAVVGYLPSLVPNLLLFGTPLPSESWRNLAYKLSPGADPMALLAYADPAAWFAVDGARLLERSAQDFAAIWNLHLGRAWFGEAAPQALATTGSWLLLATSALAVLHAPRRLWQLPLLLATWTAAIAATFFPQVRLLLPVLPLALGSAAFMLLTRTGPLVLGHGACAVVAVAIAGCAVPTLRQFVSAHPVREVAAAQALVAREGPLVRIATCYPQMARYVAAPVVYVPPPPMLDMTAARLFERVATVADQRPDFLVLSRATTPMPFDTVAAAAPPGFVVESLDAEVLVGRFIRTTADWLEHADARPTTPGRLRLRVQTRIEVGTAGFQVRAPDGSVTVLPLANTAPRTFELEVPLPSGDGRDLELTPCAVRTDGVVLRGAPLRLEPSGGR
ncbi:MAG: glycosyltransferase family 39 protein [Planctomycetes bacterium]|nr:glycosyltransferase family 39 protein [Planctomycetota bacterium]